ncbi:response regulator transcription factor [Paenibacillus doosanensis]|uniref:Transcriptional regulatory protein DegU n=1 Tax=Paenibacillus konkukensis TaxID=2020716 RepID=A0ABY4RWI3_9BACL|nr:MULTISPECIES: response regulator transcription factor [Paenibacillus]MCS7463875.1 response regulator transcription factor [Paenibacillus doosanensis]UQZ85739.1 Transcriptional regulatory protein DegU [Paenibacillus konkukensis]
MNYTMSVLIVDDHPVMAKATKGILEQIPGIEVIGIAGSGAACLDFVDMHRPDIVFLDYHLPDQFGSAVAKDIKESYPQTHVVIFTGIDIADMYNHLLEIGVSGIISKEAGESVVQTMARALMDGCTVLPLPLYRSMRLVTGAASQEVVLTSDEVQIMSMLVKGATHEQIANEIYVSKRSVDNYLKKIYNKLGVKTKVQALEQFVQSKYYSESVRGE